MLQPKKKIMIKVPKKISIERTKEVADSLQQTGDNKIERAMSYFSVLPLKDRKQSVESGKKDIYNAKRYMILAKEAEIKKK